MEEPQVLNPKPISDDLSPKRPTAYEMLMRQSRKLGGLATRTLDVTKVFLKQDIKKMRSSSFNDQENPDSRPKQVQTEQWSQSSDNNRKKRTNEDKDSQSDDDRSLVLDPKEKLKDIVHKSHQVLAGARTVMLPVNLFPDSVILDRTKITITRRDFFWSANVISFRIEDVLNVSTNCGPFFGSLTISSRIMHSTDFYEINYFWRKDAIYLKQLIQGYVIAQHNRIDTSHLERNELIKTLLELGQDSDF